MPRNSEYFLFQRFGDWGWQIVQKIRNGYHLIIRIRSPDFTANFLVDKNYPFHEMFIASRNRIPVQNVRETILVPAQVLKDHAVNLFEVGRIALNNKENCSYFGDNAAIYPDPVRYNVFQLLMGDVLMLFYQHMHEQLSNGELNKKYMHCKYIGPDVTFDCSGSEITWKVESGPREPRYIDSRETKQEAIPEDSDVDSYAEFWNLPPFGPKAVAERPFTVIVEGNLGTGKSTFIQRFANLDAVEVFQEPVDKWRNFHGENLLREFYEDPVKIGATLQSYIQLTMLAGHLANNQYRIKILERSIFGARYCFVENLRNTGYIDDINYHVLCEWFEFISQYSGIYTDVDLVIYLQTDPSIAWSRVKSRARQEEVSIDLKYITDLHQLYEDWLINKKFPVPAEVIVINANGSLEDLEIVYAEVEREIMHRGDKQSGVKQIRQDWSDQSVSLSTRFKTIQISSGSAEMSVVDQECNHEIGVIGHVAKDNTGNESVFAHTLVKSVVPNVEAAYGEIEENWNKYTKTNVAEEKPNEDTEVLARPFTEYRQSRHGWRQSCRKTHRGSKKMRKSGKGSDEGTQPIQPDVDEYASEDDLQNSDDHEDSTGINTRVDESGYLSQID